MYAFSGRFSSSAGNAAQQSGQQSFGNTSGRMMRNTALAQAMGHDPTFFESSRTISPASGSTKRKREDAGEDGRAMDDEALLNQDVVDLVDTDEVPAGLLKPKEYTKLSGFQCVICMDKCTNITVTHCGHLFCSECLHSGLNIHPNKRVCPVCRQKIDKLPQNGRFGPKAKGYYPLELKLVSKKMLAKGETSKAKSGTVV